MGQQAVRLDHGEQRHRLDTAGVAGVDEDLADAR
jgi:hypothetical protein